MTSDPQSGQYSPISGFSISHTMYFLPGGSDIKNHPTNIPCIPQGHRSNEDLPWNRTQRRPSVEGQKRLILPQCLYPSTGSCCRTSEFSHLGFIFSQFFSDGCHYKLLAAPKESFPHVPVYFLYHASWQAKVYLLRTTCYHMILYAIRCIKGLLSFTIYA